MSSTGLLYCQSHGLENKNVKKQTNLVNALVKSEITNFKFHDLHHAFASQLVRKGVSILAVQKLLGHSDSKMTQRFAHLSNDQLRNAIKKLDNRSKIDLQLDGLVYNNPLENSTIIAQRLNQ